MNYYLLFIAFLMGFALGLVIGWITRDRDN